MKVTINCICGETFLLAVTTVPGTTLRLKLATDVILHTTKDKNQEGYQG